MEPEIRFCTSGDGVRVAYATVGQGRPLVMLLGWGTNFEVEWKDPEARAWTEQLAAKHRIVRCERRGGLAPVAAAVDLSIEAQTGDLAAVADHADLERFDLCGAYDAAGVAVAYAAAHPDRIARLVFWAPFARGSDVSQEGALDGLARLWTDNWQLARRSWAGLVFPDASPERGRWYSELIKASFTPAIAAEYMRFIRDLDIAALLERVQAPVLVLARDHDRVVAPAASRAVAAMLPNATFASLPGDEAYPPFGDRSYLETMDRFLGDDARRGTALPISAGTAVILFVDIADSTAQTERMGDAAFREKARALDTALRAAVREHGGSVIEAKTLGDGILATFAAASHAVAGALACAAAGEGQGMPVHVGLHAGDVIREDENVFGGAVNIAARISALSAAGEVLVSRTVADLARTSAGVAFEDRGEHALKGVGEAVRVYAVRAREGG